MTFLLLPCSQNFCPAPHFVLHSDSRNSPFLWSQQMPPGSTHTSFQDTDAEIPLPACCCQCVIPPYRPHQWHLFSIVSNICCTYLLSQSIFTHPLPHLSFSLERLVLTFSWPLVPVFPRPLLPSSNKLPSRLSHTVRCALLSIYKAISSQSPKTLCKSNLSL